MDRKLRLSSVALGSALAIFLSTGAVAKEPVKIGFLAPFVGPLAQLGRDMDRGFKLYLDEVGYTAGGRKIVVVTEDTQARPDLGPTKARKLIESDKVDILAGIVHSGVAMSIRDLVNERKMPLVITNAGARVLTGKLKSRYIFRVSFANGQQDLAAGWYAYTKLGMKRMILVAPDYAAGHEKADGFMKTFKEAGGKVVDEMYPPLSTTDFGPYLAKILAKAKEIDGVWIFFPGSGGIRIINQYQEYGLKDTMPLFVIGDTVDDSVLPAMKDAALGIESYLHYADTIKTPENQSFVKSYLAKYKEYPGMFAEQGYIGAKVIVMALDAVKGDVDNRDAFAAALEKVKFNAPSGPFAFDKTHNVVLTIYIRKVVKIGNRYAHEVIDTIPNVDQNWSPAKMKR